MCVGNCYGGKYGTEVFPSLSSLCPCSRRLILNLELRYLVYFPWRVYDIRMTAIATEKTMFTSPIAY
jgi:hypothetical protein